MSRFAPVLASLILLAGCGGGQKWDKPGASMQDWGRENGQCMAQAQQAFPPSYPPQRPAPVVQIGRPQVQFSDGNNLDMAMGLRNQYYRSCMQGFGWRAM